MMPTNESCNIVDLHRSIKLSDITEMGMLQLMHHVDILGWIFDTYPHLLARHEAEINFARLALFDIATGIVQRRDVGP